MTRLSILHQNMNPNHNNYGVKWTLAGLNIKECKNYTCWLVGGGAGGLGAVVGGRGGKGLSITWHIIFANYLSNVKMSNTMTMEEVRKKKQLDIMRLKLYEVKFDLTCECHQNTSKTYFMNILGCFDDHQIWPQNWPHHIWASLCQVFFFINLLHRPGVWHFDIWQIISLMSDLMSDHVSDLVSEQIFIFFKFFKILLFHIF